ncbi:MAG TPA: efflux RND transporter permease subunit, partial [Sphingomicrobium sp.]|nr:efflux RND transporter permease subunit [Sphingomicrobium sp.]
MNFRNISSWCIRNPVGPIVLFVGLMLGGLVAFSQMTITQNPDIDFPVVLIGVNQPGAAPPEMEKQVTQQIEAAVRGVNGVDEIDSSVSEGYSQTVVQLQIGTPIDRAVNDVRNAIAQVRGNLPEGILEPTVQRIDTSGAPIMFVAAETTDMTLEQLSWYIDNDVAKQLRGLTGVAAVAREGGVDREIRVMLDPVALQAQGLTAAQVNQQLRQSNVNAAGGRAEVAGSEQSVRVLGNARTAYDLSQSELSLPGGRMVRLADIARVKDAYSEQRTLAKLDGRQVISFNVTRSKGASDVSVYDAVWKELHSIEKADPRVRFSEINNSVEYTKNQYKSAMEGLLEGAILAVLVVLVFLRDIRATAISALAIPMSAIPAFWFMSLLGINLNGLSLLAMSLVAGVLVDDAIVEIENIVRHMRMGKSAYQAALDAADEIGLAVLATTMSIVAVFLPVALMPGISGQFFKAFGFTVVVAVLMSLLVARMITPLIAAYFLHGKGIQPHASGRVMDRYLGLLRWSLKTSQAHAYASSHPGRWGKIKSMRFDHRLVMVGVGIGALILTGVLIATLPMTFQPPINQDTSSVQVSLPPGATLQQSEDVIDQVADIVRKDPAVESAFERINVGSGSVELKLKKDRKVTSIQFERSIAPKFAAIPDARVNFASQNGGGPGGSSRDLMLYLGGDDPVKLDAAANKIAAQMQTLPELRTPRVAGDLAMPEIVIKPRFDLAADLGVTTAALSQTIRIATLGDIEQNSAKFSLSDRQIPIQVSLAESEREDISILENLPVPTSSGGSVPLKSVAEISFGSGPVSIQRTGQQRRIAIGA